ncbi:epoxyqueuosine reductase QueH [Pseudothermotoga lettingae]|uniref:epoxyqueuosine reductase QueH n=1 Tax=Pseudothermotoga lettingae TaxID=177758 RepID=UPI000749689F|nr:epoxyqueuosine reductase QueH [Pseudothermotoga lettingae]KUK20431.1 MAG: Uncharacterized protein XD56_1657 [Pseudothermotoga lettingae]
MILHVCCAPDATTAVERLRDEGYEPVLLFFNPNIQPDEEYLKRLEAVRTLSDILNLTLIVENLPVDLWKKEIEEFKDYGEGSIRCFKCIEYRLRFAAWYAKKNNFKAFSTTLTTSPKKNILWIHSIGKKLSKDFNIEYIRRDFRKKDGFKRSVELSKMFGLYRQNYCGCIYSLREKRLGMITR